MEMEVKASVVEERERGDHLRGRVRVHRAGLDVDQWGKCVGVLKDDVSYEPRVYMSVVALQKNTTAASFFTPARHVHDSPKIVRRGDQLDMGTDREDVERPSSCR
jgi:hypothetical protein